MKMITLTGLTEHQVALLDEMWACDTMEDFDEFLQTLDTNDQEEAMRLQRMVLLAELDNVIAEMPLTESNEVLDKFRL
jgi:hypothetical protein